MPYDAAVADVWDGYAGEWDDLPGTREYAAAAFASLRSILDRAGVDLAGSRVVDFGCGTGLLTAHLVDAGARVVAVDTSAPMLAVLAAKAERLGWAEVATAADLDDLGDLGGRYDVVVCSSVCSFLDDYPGTTARLVGLLRPAGVFVQWDWERGPDEADGGLTRGEVADALAGAGLVGSEVAPAFEVDVDGEVMRPLVGHGRRGHAGEGA